MVLEGSKEFKMMTPDDSKLVAAAANRKGAKKSRNKAMAVVASVKRSKDEDLFFDSDNETGHDIEYTDPSRSSLLSADALMGDGESENTPSRRHPLPTRSKGKGRHKLLVWGAPEPGDIEKRPANPASEERCYQELLDLRYQVSPTSGS
jgi:hypothetical protein